VLEGLIRHARIRTAALSRLLISDTLCATDLAEYLVERGVAFSEAHEIVGRVVAHAEQAGKSLRSLQPEELRRFSPKLDRRALALLDPRVSVARKRSAGSTNPRLVAQALRRWRQRLGP
jgi:argininosuccinate lyase